MKTLKMFSFPYACIYILRQFLHNLANLVMVMIKYVIQKRKTQKNRWNRVEFPEGIMFDRAVAASPVLRVDW